MKFLWFFSIYLIALNIKFENDPWGFGVLGFWGFAFAFFFFNYKKGGMQ